MQLRVGQNKNVHFYQYSTEQISVAALSNAISNAQASQAATIASVQQAAASVSSATSTTISSVSQSLALQASAAIVPLLSTLTVAEAAAIVEQSALVASLSGLLNFQSNISTILTQEEAQLPVLQGLIDSQMVTSFLQLQLSLNDDAVGRSFLNSTDAVFLTSVAAQVRPWVMR